MPIPDVPETFSELKSPNKWQQNEVKLDIFLSFTVAVVLMYKKKNVKPRKRHVHENERIYNFKEKQKQCLNFGSEPNQPIYKINNHKNT